jgi:hypothetical protein
VLAWRQFSDYRRGARVVAPVVPQCGATVGRSGDRSNTFRASRTGDCRQPTTPYDIPLWCEPRVGRNQLAAVDNALYSMPHP